MSVDTSVGEEFISSHPHQLKEYPRLRCCLMRVIPIDASITLKPWSGGDELLPYICICVKQLN
jgi:hypothetical protein